MDKSTKIQIRISFEALAAFDAQAKAEGLTRTAFLINSAWMRVPLAAPAPRTTSKHKPASTQPQTPAATDEWAIFDEEK